MSRSTASYAGGVATAGVAAGVVREGELFKAPPVDPVRVAKSRKKWRRRFFVLSRTDLAYYESRSKKKVRPHSAGERREERRGKKREEGREERRENFDDDDAIEFCSEVIEKEKSLKTKAARRLEKE
jgi:hypothetical protein